MNREAAAQAIRMFLRALGRDPDHDPDLVGTGERVAAAYADELLAGYAVDVDALLAQSVFAGRSGLVVVRDVAIVTTCPHHLMPSSGLATVAFAPDEHLIGIGTVPRLLDAFARRLMLQEHLGERVVAAIQKHLAPQWAACKLTLSHTCMTARGERAHGARVETLAIAGGNVRQADVFVALGVGR
jgi:GTP cyclohydrolase I